MMLLNFKVLCVLLTGLAVGSVASLFPVGASAQEVAVIHCPGSCPQYRSSIAANNSRVVIHHLYAAGVNNYTRRADWVAYRLTAEAFGVASLLPRDWQTDRLAGFADISELADMAELEPERGIPDVSSAASAYGGMATPVAESAPILPKTMVTIFTAVPMSWEMPAALR